ncbi:hypothetical protein PENSPDRAFT_690473 [Peniophora sp. CONT]|nr:hypothetical protein PENSPDRAFT_690473 [Peniophora sp. CONT]
MSTVSTLSMTALSSPLVVSLNKLLSGLSLPFTMETPLDLTPSLLLAILESLLESRLPIPSRVRDSRDQASRVQALKIFLGVLENDVIKQDVGLSDIDPRRLAAGEWDETVFIGELLVWLGKQMGFLRSSRGSVSSAGSAPPPLHAPVARSSTRESITSASASSRSSVRGTGVQPQASSSYHKPTLLEEQEQEQFWSPESTRTSQSSAYSFAHEEDETRTTLASMEEEESVSSSQSYANIHRPRCIHEVEDSFLLGSSHGHLDYEGDSTHELEDDDTRDSLGREPCSFCSHDASEYMDEESGFVKPPVKRLGGKPRLVRYDGYIDEVDSELEVRAFESRTVRRAPSTITPPTRRVVTRHTSPSQHTLALLNERARLLSELARLNLKG